jgi:predicted nucleic acid-binding protein
MRVADATFLIDFLNGSDAVSAHLSTIDDESVVTPATAYTEVLVGVGNQDGGTSVAAVRNALDWIDVVDVSERHAAIGAEIASEIAPHGPNFSGMDATIAAVGRKLDAPILSRDGDFTHEATQAAVEVDQYAG